MTDNRIIQLKTNPSPGYVYLISAVGNGIFKIGKTKVSVLNRLRCLQTSSPVKLRYVYHAYVENVDMTELELHRRFSLSRQVGEWFSLTQTEVKECILLMRLVQEPEPEKILGSVETEIEAKIEIEEKTEAETEVEAETEAKFCLLGFTKIEAIEQIERLRKKLNQTQTIERLWDCRKGDSKAWRQAYAQFQELMAENATVTSFQKK